jgi:hypothetical protein
MCQATAFAFSLRLRAALHLACSTCIDASSTLDDTASDFDDTAARPLTSMTLPRREVVGVATARPWHTSTFLRAPSPPSLTRPPPSSTPIIASSMTPGHAAAIQLASSSLRQAWRPPRLRLTSSSQPRRPSSMAGGHGATPSTTAVSTPTPHRGEDPIRIRWW